MKKEAIGKIIADIKLRPQLLTIFVEGSTDESIIRVFLTKTGNSRFVAVRRIDFVEIDEMLVSKYDLNFSNNKHKVVALAKEIEASGLENNSIIFIIDKDLDFILKNDFAVKKLIYTDYSCIESYIFSKEHLDEFFTLSAFSLKGTLDSTFSNLKTILHQLFAFRIEHEIQELCLEQIEYKNKCKFNTNEFIFDLETYTFERLAKRHLQSNTQTFLESVKLRLSSLMDDERNLINGHDYEYILYYYVFHCGNRHLQFNQFQGIMRLLFSDCSYLLRQPLFSRIHDFANHQ